MKVRLLFLTILTAVLSSCSIFGLKKEVSLRNMSAPELHAYISDTSNPADSVSRSIILYTCRMNSQQKSKECNAYLDSLSNDAGYASFKTDINLCKAFLSFQRTSQDTTFHYLSLAEPGIEKGCSELVMDRYACAAFTCRMVCSDESVVKALDYCHKAIQYGKNHPGSVIIADIYNYLSWAQTYLGQYYESLENTRIAVALAHQQHNKVQEAWGYTVLSWGFGEEFMFAEEMMTARMAYDLVKDEQLMEIKALTARTLAWAYEDAQKKDSALLYFREAIDVYDKLDDPSLAARIDSVDVQRLQDEGCYRPDSAQMLRAMRLESYTQVIIDQSQTSLKENDFDPQIEEAHRRLMLTLFTGAAIILGILIVLQFVWRIYRKHKIHTRRQLLQSHTDLRQKEEELKEANELLQHHESHIANLIEQQKDKDNTINEMKRLYSVSAYSLDEARKDSRTFVKKFLEDNPRFNAMLQSHMETISHHDYLMCILIAIGTPRETIIDILNIRTESFNVSRHRLRSKLNLSRDENLDTFLRKILDDSNKPES